MPVSTTQVALALALTVTLAFAWRFEARERLRSRLEARFLYGVPWGTAVTVIIVVAFYLLAQGGLREWGSPIVYPFVTWSYFYPTGMVTAGIAHGSPQHLLSNMAATLVFAPIAEYAWSHYPPTGSRGRSDSMAGTTSEAQADTSEFPRVRPDGGRSPRWLARPWIRAVVIFPAGLFGVALLTAVFSLGPGLGFSGAVYAIVGFALVNYPLTTIVATVGTSAVNFLVGAFGQPVIRETIAVGPPMPPNWAGVGFQAHLLGFLVGALLGIALLSQRGRRPAADRVFVAMVLVGTAQSLWLLVWPGGDDTYYLYQGAGAILVLALAVFVTVAVAERTRPLPRPLERFDRVPSRTRLATLWIVLLVALLALLLVSAVVAGEAVALVGLSAGTVAVTLAIPAIAVIVARRRSGDGTLSHRDAAVVCLVILTVLIAAPSAPLSLAVVDDRTVPEDGITTGEYTVLYAENQTSGQSPVVDLGDEEFFASELDGVLVINPEMELWTVATREELLAHEGNATVHVGDVGWRTAIEVERTGWEVVGNDTVYAVDLETDDEAVRSFQSAPSTANVQIDDHRIEVAPTDDDFEVQVIRDGNSIGSTTIPDVNETATVDDLEVRTESADGAERVIVELDGTSVQVAETETYR